MKSSPELRLLLSAEAFEDLIDIQNYTFSEFGEKQWLNYESLLDKALQSILSNPHIGYKREDLPQSCQAWNAGQHVIIYRIDHPNILIIRVLHQRMNFSFRF